MGQGAPRQGSLRARAVTPSPRERARALIDAATPLAPWEIRLVEAVIEALSDGAVSERDAKAIQRIHDRVEAGKRRRIKKR